MQRLTRHCAFRTCSAVRATHKATAIWKALPRVWFSSTEFSSMDTPDSKLIADVIGEEAKQKPASIVQKLSHGDACILQSFSSWQTPDAFPPQDATAQKTELITPSISGSELYGPEMVILLCAFAYTLHTEPGSWHTPDDLPIEEYRQQLVTSSLCNPKCSPFSRRRSNATNFNA
eukprot:gnl/MRDRNA2_/MRDRNA2_89539_c0_seq1.p1 gnl/MRDRNA2_/MRDRNA2_89539_c0~~gnl/MRDRNA2_/MRDRNA2_89539_c0_seq1.p1  ORF type:complete len:175 (+),score=20.08 gnl/MRDRNA2_/MRDRNA2_89539_c0_seq1:72-596(+)